MNYYLLGKNKKPKGPYPLARLRDLWKAGKIPAGTLCCEKGGEIWLPIENVEAITDRPIADDTIGEPSTRPVFSSQLLLKLLFVCLAVLLLAGVSYQVLKNTDDVNGITPTDETKKGATSTVTMFGMWDLPNSSAIIKGSFTVWTVPEDPSPTQSYWIKIQVKHEKTLVNYTRNDLTGTVVGTDDYHTSIATHMPANLLVKDNVARLELEIPGGAKLVRDVIQVKSSILNEEQTIAIVF